MRRALVCVKLSDISSKTAKKCIFCVFRLFLSLFGTILVKPHQCRLHQSILPTQGPIHEIFMEKYWKLAELDNEAVLSRSFLLLFFIYLFKFFLLHLNGNKQPIHISAIWRVSSESWKKLHPNLYEHDCITVLCNHYWTNKFRTDQMNLQYVFEGCGKDQRSAIWKKLSFNFPFPIGNKFGLFHYCVGGGFKRRKVEERSWLAHGVQHTPMGGHLVKVQLPVLLSATYVCFIPNSFSLVT